MVRRLGVFFLFYAAIVALHWNLLRLPYFWDEAGYYIPAAHDFLLNGSLVPTSTLSNAHPPLPALYLAIWWKLFGYTPLITRLAMLTAAAMFLREVLWLSWGLTNSKVAISATVLTAIYPVVFAQSSLAHADLLAGAFTLWGLRLYFTGVFTSTQPNSLRLSGKTALAFTLAALSKETAITIPLALFAWELFWWARKQHVAFWHFRFQEVSEKDWQEIAPKRFPETLALLAPAVPLAAWYGFHFFKTGHIFGNPEYYRYNVASTLSVTRFLLAALQRLWHLLGHMNMWVLTLLGCAAMLLKPQSDGDCARRRIDMPVQWAIFVILLSQAFVYSLLGGALLTRYLLPCFPLVILIWASTLWRRVPAWPWLVALVAGAFVLGSNVDPPYRFSPEDNLNYASYVRLHQEATQVLDQRLPGARILSAWPATDELSKSYLGYVGRPHSVVSIEVFTLEHLLAARQRSDFDAALLFSTKYEPASRLFDLEFWRRINTRYFGYHRDLPPEAAAQILGGRLVWKKEERNQWVALVVFDRSQDAD